MVKRDHCRDYGCKWRAWDAYRFEEVEDKDLYKNPNPFLCEAKKNGPEELCSKDTPDPKNPCSKCTKAGEDVCDAHRAIGCFWYRNECLTTCSPFKEAECANRKDQFYQCYWDNGECSRSEFYRVLEGRAEPAGDTGLPLGAIAKRTVPAMFAAQFGKSNGVAQTPFGPSSNYYDVTGQAQGKAHEIGIGSADFTAKREDYTFATKSRHDKIDPPPEPKTETPAPPASVPAEKPAGQVKTSKK